MDFFYGPILGCLVSVLHCLGVRFELLVGDFVVFYIGYEISPCLCWLNLTAHSHVVRGITYIKGMEAVGFLSMVLFHFWVAWGDSVLHCLGVGFQLLVGDFMVFYIGYEMNPLPLLAALNCTKLT